jgi:hypothetical protein
MMAWPVRRPPCHNMILNGLVRWVVKTAAIVLLSSAIFLAGCDRLPESFPPPEQRHPVEGLNPGTSALMVEMGDLDADLAIVKDIYGRADPSWRWTSQNPTIQVLLLSTENLKFHADFAVWDDSFKVTGPVEIAFLVNDRPLDKVRYTTPGVKKFEKLVPFDWLSAASPTTLGMSVDKIYVAPKDGKKFGVILVRMGLTK